MFHGFINRQNFAPYPKNPNLRKFFTAFGWTEEIGSGVRNTSHYLPLYTGGALPTFEEKEIFVTTLPLKHYVFRPYVSQFASWLGLPVDCTEHLMAAMGKMEIPVALHDASFEDMILELVPSWMEKGLKYGELELAKNESAIKLKIKEDPSWVEKGPKLVSKKLWYLIAILSLCTKETSAADIMHYIGYNSLKSFRTRYLMPLRQTGLLALTKPETPNAPDNKYVLTDLGRAFLMGR